jgi:hypothetical protein
MIGKTILHFPREIFRQFDFVYIDLPNISRGELEKTKIIGKS